MNLQDKLLDAAQQRLRGYPYSRSLCIAALLLLGYMGQAQRIEVVNHKGTKLQLGVEVTTDTLAPTSPTPIAGDLWYDTSMDENNPIAKTYDGSQWIRLAENATVLFDTDGDTRIQVEESDNDDTIRFDVDGKQRMTITSQGMLSLPGIPAPDEVMVIIGSALETYTAANFTFYNSTNSNGLPATLFNGAFESAGDSFHAQREGSTTADWGIGYSFDASHQITAIRLRSRADALGARAGGGIIQLYNNGTLVASSASYQLTNANAWGPTYAPNVAADEIRYIFSNGSNTSNGDGTLNFSEWEISGKTLSTATTASLLVASGNVGIGTTDPSERLHIDGTIRIDANGTEIATIDASGIHGALADKDGNTKIQVEEGNNDDKIRFDLAGSEYLILDSNGRLNIRNNNTVVGRDAAQALTNGDNNSVFGRRAMESNTSGGSNIALGFDALRYNTNGNQNTALGINALYTNKRGNFAVAIGYDAQRNANDRDDANWENKNTAVGFSALKGSGTPANNTGNWNTAIGHNSLSSNTSGNDNVAIGNNALSANTQGSDNIAIGDNALNGNTTGAKNVVIGDASGGGITTGSANTIIGSHVNGLGAQLSNTIIIADGDGNKRIYVDNTGDVGIGTTNPTARMHVAGNVGNSYLMRLENTHDTDGEGLLISGKGTDATPLLNINGGTNGSTGVMRVRANGVVTIGSPTIGTNVKLAVQGNITASGSITPDFVFQKYFTGSSTLKEDYTFMPLDEVARFVATNHHLPGVPSAAEVTQAGGIVVNRATELNLEKIEELFLHLIELKEENDTLKTRLQAIEEKLGMKN